MIQWAERAIASLLVTAHDHDRAAALQREAVPAGEVLVTRVEQYVEHHAPEALSLRTLAREAGVSARALQLAFRKHRGRTPMQRVRDIRLARVHEALLNFDPEVRVTDVALRCGFTHLGRFSALYAKAFGEPPSATLQRSRANHAPPLPPLVPPRLPARR